jgi:DNA helicase IV
MERVAAAASLPRHVVDDVLDRTRVQFTETTERAWAHVTDRDRLVAVDRRALDDGTATGHATTVDVEDYAVLFELERLRAVRHGEEPATPRAYDLVAIDEAQELAPLELALIGRSLARDGTLVVSGDADQHTDETSSFLGWDAVMRELGASDHTRTTLEIGYRCPDDVVAVARGIRGGARPRATVAIFDHPSALAAHLGRAAKALLDRDRSASVAVVCRLPMTARGIAASLRNDEVPSRVVFDGRFLPRGPVQVTLASEVKGLEFDYVVIPDASARDWPDDPASRRALYVAVTRARRQVLFGCTGMPTPVLASSP